MMGLLLAAVVQCPDGTPPPCRGAARPPAPTSVAVLYFDNRSRDSTDAYLAEGLTEQTIAQLGEVSRLTVASRFAVRRFRGEAAQDPAAVGRALNVSYLVSGSVQRSGDRLRVGVELVRASTGVRVWGENYDRTDTDLLRLQDDIASNVATGIVGRLLPAERRAVTARATRNPQAYDRFLRGNFQLARRDPPSLLLALRDYQAAMQLDPAFVAPVARSAYAYGLALDNQYDIGLVRDTMVARGLALAEQALRLDSLSSDAWLAAAYMAMGRDPVAAQGARERFERAIALDPRSAEAHHQFASFLGYMGDTAGAARGYRRALELEPGRAISWVQLAQNELVARRPRQAVALIDSGLAADPQFELGFIMRFVAGVSLRDTAVMRSANNALRSRPGFAPFAALFDLFATAVVTGDSATRAQLGAIVAGAAPARPTLPGNSVAGSFLAAMLAEIGEGERALQMLEGLYPRGFRLHDGMRNPMLDSIRDDPRFVRLWNETRAPGQLW